MAHEILSLKLCQLDERMEKLHSRIPLSETADWEQLQQEIGILQKEHMRSEAILRKTLQYSKSSLVAVLAASYEQVEQIVLDTKERMKEMAEESGDIEAVVEEKLLLAEYALDFAYQAADSALLLSLEAIESQMIHQSRMKSG